MFDFVDEFRRATVVILFPLVVLFFALMFSVFINTTPSSTLYMDLSFGKDHVNVSESWIIPTNGGSSVYRRLPHGGPFEDMHIDAISCSGKSFMGYDGSYVISCAELAEETAVLGITYTLRDPYICYDDLCYFNANFFDKAVLNLVEIRFFGISDQATFPDLQFIENKGRYVGNPSRLMVSVSLPTQYSDTGVGGIFQDKFDALHQKYKVYTRLESDWLINFLILVSFESFVAFILYIIMGLEKNVKSSGHISVSPSKRPLHEVAHLFFRDVEDEAIVSATILSLASRGYIDMSGRHIKIIKRTSKHRFEERILDFLSAISEKNKIFLSEDWIKVRVEEIGRDVFDELLDEVYDSMVLPRTLTKEIYDSLGNRILLAMQFIFAAMPAITYFTLPLYLINFKLSMFLLGIMNVFWILLTLRVGGTAFGRYSLKGATEKALWLSFKRFIKSQVAIEKSDKVEWDYVFAFASLFDMEDAVINAAERKHKYFRNIQHPRSAVHVFDMILRASRQIQN